MTPFLPLSIDSLQASFARSVSLTLPTDGTGKRKVDGTLAATRLGSTATEKWANERFRQVMVLVREFRNEWPNVLITADDVMSIRMLLDCALYTATRTQHKGDIC